MYWHISIECSSLWATNVATYLMLLSIHYHFSDILDFMGFNTILHGLLEILYHMGGDQTIPPIKIHQNDSNLVERHVLAKIDYCCPLFMHLELNHYHFWPQKGPKNRCIFRHIEGSPLWIACGKNSGCKIFWKFKKISQKWTTQEH